MLCLSPSSEVGLCSHVKHAGISSQCHYPMFYTPTWNEAPAQLGHGRVHRSKRRLVILSRRYAAWHYK